jgi:hypothetical protein
MLLEGSDSGLVKTLLRAGLNCVKFVQFEGFWKKQHLLFPKKVVPGQKTCVFWLRPPTAILYIGAYGAAGRGAAAGPGSLVW